MKAIPKTTGPNLLYNPSLIAMQFKDLHFVSAHNSMYIYINASFRVMRTRTAAANITSHGVNYRYLWSISIKLYFSPYGMY